MLNSILEDFKNQMDEETEKKVEIIVNADGGEKLVGQKRNEILEQANGKFISFVDDDDKVDSSYIKEIVNIIENNDDLDCIGFSGKYYIHGKFIMVFKHANKYGSSYTDDEGIQYRTINHINPTRTEIVKQIKFLEQNFGEDSDYCNRLLDSGLLKNEIILDKVMYHYFWDTEVTKTHEVVRQKEVKEFMSKLKET